MAEAGYFIMSGYAILGITIVTLASTFNSLAENIGYVSSDCGTVFISRGFGCVAGSIASFLLYDRINAKYVIAVTLVPLNIIIGILPMNHNLDLLRFYYFLMGVFTAVIDFGLSKLTNLAYQKRAGPWLGWNNILFGLFGSIVPLLAIISKNDLHKQYIGLTILICILSAIFIAGPNVQISQTVNYIFIVKEIPATVPSNSSSGTLVSSIRGTAPHYYVEIIAAIIFFCLYGGLNSATTFISQYVEVQNLMGSMDETRLIFTFWIMVTIGRFFGVIDQVKIKSASLAYHLSFLLFIGIISMIIIIGAEKSSAALWIGIVIYGLSNGPCFGMCTDVVSRLTRPSTLSSIILAFGTNLGLALVPFIATVIWDDIYGPGTLIVLILVSMLASFLLAPTLHYVSYKGVSVDEERMSIFAGEDGNHQYWTDLQNATGSANVVLNYKGMTLSPKLKSSKADDPIQ